MSKTTNAFCKACHKKLDNNHCYNPECTEYDPISQYFEHPLKEEIAQDYQALQERLGKELAQPISNNDDTPF
jgi:hypothetical protein